MVGPSWYGDGNALSYFVFALAGPTARRSDEKAAETPSAPAAVSTNDFRDLVGRGEWIRTTDLVVPKRGAYFAAAAASVSVARAPLRMFLMP